LVVSVGDFEQPIDPVLRLDLRIQKFPTVLLELALELALALHQPRKRVPVLRPIPNSAVDAVTAAATVVAVAAVVAPTPTTGPGLIATGPGLIDPQGAHSYHADPDERGRSSQRMLCASAGGHATRDPGRGLLAGGLGARNP
jgi:hypothetical protein